METLIDLISDAAAKFKHKPALTWHTGLRDQIWSYSQLWQEIQIVARQLQERGIRQGDFVLLLAPNSPYYVAGLLGIMLRGAIAVPIDLGSTQEFIRNVAENTGAVALIGNAKTAPRTLVCYSFADLLTGPATTYDGPSPRTNDIAEIIYTSGTTGNPKGVVLTHANIVASVLSASAMVPLSHDCHLLSLLPLSHMFEQTIGLFGPLMRCAVIHYGISRQTAAIDEAMKHYRINVIVAVPKLLLHMFQGIERGVHRNNRGSAWKYAHWIAPHLFMSLRRLLFRQVHARLGGKFEIFVCGGAYLPPETEQAWERLGVKVIQGYGASECAPLIACNSLQTRLPGSVGRPVPGVDVRIAEDGEIQVRGANVFSGYWHNESATAASLLEGGWYCTGDLGEFDTAGNLRIKGRKKDRVVLPSGMNVFLEDIEQVLDQQPGIRASIVMDVKKPNGKIGFTAVLLMEVGRTNAAEEAISQANKQLAPYQRINNVRVWDKDDFPRTTIGKLKRFQVRTWLDQSNNSSAALEPQQNH